MRTFQVYLDKTKFCVFNGTFHQFQDWLEQRGFVELEWKVLNITDISPQPSSCS